MTRVACLCALALLLACAVPDGMLLPPQRAGFEEAPGLPAPLPEARLSVEVWSGYRTPPGSEAREPDHVELVLDLTSSMETREERRPPRYMGAREAAARLIEALPPDTSIGVRALGISNGAECVGTTRVAQGSVRALGNTLRTHLRALRPRAEGSLAAALASVRQHPNGPLDRTRVVVFTDLGNECSSDPCEAGRELAAAGARLEFVVFGGASAPACFADFSPEQRPRIASQAIETPRPNFRVELHDIDSRRRGAVVARGRADGTSLSLSPVPVLVVVDMDPPALIGPIQLEPNGHTRIRILDFPALDPPVREWGWETLPASGPIARGGPTPIESTPAPKRATTVPRRAVAQPG